MAKAAHFSPKLFRFLKELKANNDRGWFQENRPRYERDVRQPLLQFISDVGPHLRKISRHVLADPRPVGGSMFRIHRDVRFSRDKSPYKTHASAQFRHVAGKDVHAPGFYLHLEPGSVFFGAGIWHPDATALGRIRAALDGKGKAWVRLRDDRTFRKGWELAGDSLKRPPRGYDPDHPLVEDLKRKDFIAVRRVPQSEVCRVEFLERFVGSCQQARPLMRFLASALEMPF